MTQEHTPRANGISSHPMHEPRVAITRGDATRDVARRWASSSHASLSLRARNLTHRVDQGSALAIPSARKCRPCE